MWTPYANENENGRRLRTSGQMLRLTRIVLPFPPFPITLLPAFLPSLLPLLSHSSSSSSSLPPPRPLSFEAPSEGEKRPGNCLDNVELEPGQCHTCTHPMERTKGTGQAGRQRPRPRNLSFQRNKWDIRRGTWLFAIKPAGDARSTELRKCSNATMLIFCGNICRVQLWMKKEESDREIHCIRAQVYIQRVYQVRSWLMTSCWADIFITPIDSP